MGFTSQPIPIPARVWVKTHVGYPYPRHWLFSRVSWVWGPGSGLVGLHIIYYIFKISSTLVIHIGAQGDDMYMKCKE